MKLFFIFSFCYLLAGLIVAAWFVAELFVWAGRKTLADDRKYDFLYQYISGQLELPVNDCNYQIIRDELIKLSKFKSRGEQTDVLRRNFYRKYGKLISEYAVRKMEVV